MTYKRNGVSYRKVRSRPSRWGGGKVHVAKYSKLTMGWEPVCMPASLAGIGMGYPIVDDYELTTCRLCQVARDEQGKGLDK